MSLDDEEYTIDEEKVKDDAEDATPEADDEEDGEPVKESESGADDSGDDETEAKRERRRREKRLRAENRRLARDRDRSEIQRLREKIHSLEKTFKTTTHTYQLNQVDRAIDETEAKLQQYTNFKRHALENGEPDKVIMADEALAEQRERLRNLKVYREQNNGREEEASDDRADPRVRQRQAIVTSKATQWVKKTGFGAWSEIDQKIARNIDDSLVAEGWDPTEDDYYEEFTERVKEYLPYRFKSQAAARPKAKVTTGGSANDLSVAANNEEKGLPRDYILSCQQAGMWETPEQRKRMRERYMEEAKKGKR